MKPPIGDDGHSVPGALPYETVFTSDHYELVDFGNGRKLERFGDTLLDRPCPAAEGKPVSIPDAWTDADGQFSRGAGSEGKWNPATSKRKNGTWTISHDRTNFGLRMTPFGHVGVFPEQAKNWDWIAKQVARSVKKNPEADPPKVLNLFAYTGGSTLASAAAGAQVVHVDAAKNTVAWARENAAASGLDQSPIRWIVEDAARFVSREVKRGNKYDAVILDPPSYGHGPKGEPWKLGDHLHDLLRGCKELTSENRQFVLLTCHSPGFDESAAEAILAQTFFGHCGAGATAQSMYLTTSSGRRLHAGVAARWPG